MPWPAHPPSLVARMIFDEWKRLRRSSLHFSPSASSIVIIRPKYVTQHPIPQQRLCALLMTRNEISYKYKTTDNILLLYILILRFADIKQKDKNSWGNRYDCSFDLMCSLFLQECNFEMLIPFKNIWNFQLFQNTYSLFFVVHFPEFFSGEVNKYSQRILIDLSPF
jgi:hypothetical protein